MKVSIACPTFEYYGRGVEVLDDMFRTIANQTLKDLEVVVSDHSKIDVIKDFCEENVYNLDIKYFRNENGRGNPSINTNNAPKPPYTPTKTDSWSEFCLGWLIIPGFPVCQRTPSLVHGGGALHIVTASRCLYLTSTPP